MSYDTLQEDIDNQFLLAFIGTREQRREARQALAEYGFDREAVQAFGHENREAIEAQRGSIPIRVRTREKYRA